MLEVSLSRAKSKAKIVDKPEASPTELEVVDHDLPNPFEEPAEPVEIEESDVEAWYEGFEDGDCIQIADGGGPENEAAGEGGEEEEVTEDVEVLPDVGESESGDAMQSPAGGSVHSSDDEREPKKKVKSAFQAGLWSGL